MKTFVRRGLNLVSARTAILLYHRIADVAQDPWHLAVHPENFAEQLEVLRTLGVIRLPDAEPCALRPLRQRCSAAITFDDGYTDNYTQALPLLERYEVPATFFIATRPVRKHLPFWWDELQSILFDTEIAERVCVKLGAQEVVLVPGSEETPVEALRRLHPLMQQLDIPERWTALDQLRGMLHVVPSPPPSSYAMTEEQLQRMSRHPLVEIGAHTVTHPKLSVLSPERQWEEIQDSRTYLEMLLGRAVTSFAYPYGASVHFTSGTEQLVRVAGFSQGLYHRARCFPKAARQFPHPPSHRARCKRRSVLSLAAELLRVRVGLRQCTCSARDRFGGGRRAISAVRPDL